MKKIIGIVFISLMFANIAFAEIEIIDGKQLRTGGWVNIIATSQVNSWTRVDTVCVDGYKFVVSRNKTGTISMVQFYERAGGVSLPAKC